MKTSRTSRGFTLIELLVVITIIGIIAAIAISNTSRRSTVREHLAPPAGVMPQ